MAESENTPQPLSPTTDVEETAPLLSAGANEASGDVNAETTPSYAPNPRYIKIASYFSLVGSIAAGTFILGVLLITQISRYDFPTWHLRRLLPVLGSFVSP
jgi:hypothetical protein